jgi:phage terminase large subunit
MTSLVIQSKFHPRPYQLPILKALNNGFHKAVWCCHRRAGKDITIFNWCIEKLISETCTCYYIMPTYAQAKKVIWDATTNDGMRILDFIPPEIIAQKNQQEMKIRFSNGSLLQLIGSDNIDALMGTNPKIVIFSEYALQTSDAWDFIRPIIKVNNGYAIFIGTPRGRNHFYDLYEMAKTQPDWFVQKLTYKDTCFITEEDIQKEIAEGMSQELAEQEYSCSFDRGVDGAYYAKLISKMIDDNRILPLTYDPYKLVHTSFDLGWDDSTSIIFFQIDGERIKIIDHEEHSSKTLHWYKQLLTQKGYQYGTHLFPHDVEHVDGLSTGLTRKEILEDLQISVTVVPRSFIVDGIEAVKVLLSSRIMINSSCKTLIKSLENYHREWDNNKKVYHNKPRHDQWSHSCDSIRYLAEGLRFIQNARGTDDDIKAINSYWGN